MSGAPSLEQRMDDVRAVMDLIGSARAILIGFSEGAAMSILFAATYPERVTHLSWSVRGYGRPCRTTCGAKLWSAG
jgi:pimeloyl-ACP methyl ester carboxylesterase